MTNFAFSDFSKPVIEAGLKAERKAGADYIFFVKLAKKGAGKVEFNTKSNTFVVVPASQHLAVVTEAVQKAGFNVAKVAKGWTVLEAAGLDKMGRFIELVKVVEQAVPYQAKIFPAKAKKDPIQKARDSVNKAIEKVTKPQTAEQIMRAAEIKAKNLATMKAVSAKLSQEAA